MVTDRGLMARLAPLWRRDVQTWAIIPIGWPLRRFGPVKRRPFDEVVHRERW